jgi:N-acetyl-anhydromuramyl-L-alanine amidase AmpD
MPKFRIIQRHAEHHGGKRPLSQLTAIVLHETEGHNGGDYGVLLKGGPGHVSVGYWIPDYNDADAAPWRQDDVYTIVQFLPLTVAGNSVGSAWAPYGNANTVSIELGNYGSESYGEAQLAALDYLIAHIDKEVGRPLMLKTHAEIALPKGRKTDPGRTFPLAAYRKWRAHEEPGLGPERTLTATRLMAAHKTSTPDSPRVWWVAWRGKVTTRGKELHGCTLVTNAHGVQGWLPTRYLRD